MPFKSKAQQRFMFAAESRGEVPKGTAKEWAHKTKSIKALPEHVKYKKTASEIADGVLMSKTAALPGWAECKERSKKKTASELAQAALATDGRATSAMHDFYEGAKWAPGGIEYQGPMKIAFELPTNVNDRAPSAIGAIIGAPKWAPPKLPEMPRPPKAKKTAAEIAMYVMKKTAFFGDEHENVATDCSPGSY